MAGEATIQELEELDKLVAQHPEWKFFAEQFVAENETAITNDTTHAEAAWAAHAANMQLTGRFQDVVNDPKEESAAALYGPSIDRIPGKNG
jgi:hypothetical protein